MRKTLLLTVAAITVGIITTKAQVYSANVVGYVNKVMPAGFALIANPLQNTNDTLNTIIPVAPDGATIFKYDSVAQTFDPVTPLYVEGFGWDPNGTLKPGEGAFISSPSAFTNTFVGEVLQGSLTNQVPAAFSLLASKVPIAGTMSVVLTNLVALDGDTAFTYDTGAQSYNPNPALYVEGFGWDPDNTVAVGESVFYFRNGAATTWVRTFTVQ